MAILPFLFQKKKKEPEPETPQGDFPKLRENMTLRVFPRINNLIFLGKLVYFTPTTLRIERLPVDTDGTPDLKGKSVYIEGANDENLPFVLKGTLQDLTSTECRIDNVVSLYVCHQRRTSFRLALDAPVQLQRLALNGDQYEPFGAPETCRLVNISIGGACIQVDTDYLKGNLFQLVVEPAGYPAMTFTGENVWCSQMDNGQHRYGIRFTETKHKEIEVLNRMIFELQKSRR